MGNIRTRKIILKTSSFIMSAVMALSLFLSEDLKVHAASTNIQTQLTTLSVSFKHILASKQEALIDEIKDKVIENGWDYSLTLQNMDKVSSFKDIDYVDMLAAYMTAKEYCRDNRLNFTYLEDIPLISYELTEKTITEKIPVKIDRYVEKDGYYTKDKTIYLIEDEDVGVYEYIEENGLYKKTGTKKVILEEKETTYAEVTFKVMTPEELLDKYDLPEDIFSDYKERIKKLSENTGKNGLYQTIFAQVPTMPFNYIYEGNSEIANETFNRRLLCETAGSLIGMVPYEWGGKPRKAGYDSSWWLFNDKNEQNGLDCSGFVQWAFMTAGYDKEIYTPMISTNSILSAGFEEISYEELRPGDIGVKQGKAFNHTGIYMGEGQWIHCSSDAATVKISPYDFTKFYKVIQDNVQVAQVTDYEDIEEDDDEDEDYDTDDDYYELDEDEEEDEEPEYEPDLESTIRSTVFSDTESNIAFTDEDVLLVASLIQHEAGSEGLNGWIAVGEVVRNRLMSDLFPNTASEVVYQKGQFTTARQLAGSVPSEEIIVVARAVLSGQMSIFNEPSVMYFKNPKITDGIPSTEKKDWGKYKYYKAIGNHAFYTQP